ncbi:hypothetical protein ACFX13_008161 [Malus domestica]
MLSKTRSISSYLHTRKPTLTPSTHPATHLQSQSISSLKVVWRKDQKLDQAIENDKPYKLCARVVKEVHNEPGRVIPLRYLENRRERLRLNIKVKTFLRRNPGLFDVYYDRIKPKSEPVQFLRFSDRLRMFLEEEERIFKENEPLIVSKLCKLLMMCRDRVVSVDKLVHVKREFGFPNDFLVSLVPKYPQYFRILGCPGEENCYLELVSWNPEFAKSVIERRAEEESNLTGIRVRPNFNYRLPSGFFLKKEMREWVWDWVEMDYISPYEDVLKLDQASQEMEKRTVGVFHELLSLSLFKRIPVPILGKFSDEYRFSNAFSNAFTRHAGIFYLSLKGGIKTAVLREAYKDDQLIDRDPLLEIKDKFAELLEEGWRGRREQLRLQREEVEKDKEMMTGARSVVETPFGRVCTSPNTNRVFTPNEWESVNHSEPEAHSLASLLYLPKMEAQPLFPPVRPLCRSQFALANYACSILPFTPMPLPTPPSPPPPSPPNDDGQEEQHGHGHGHDHGHRHVHHRHRHHVHDSIPAEDNCCRWLTQLDNQCVCELLAHLPNFLVRPAHVYSVVIGETCTVTYTCGTPVRIKI